MRFGVLGTGFWAREIHAASIAEHEDAELVGVWGRDLAKAKALGAQFDVQGYDDLDALLAEVAAEVGFYDQAHLARHFRRFIATTPGRFVAPGGTDGHAEWGNGADTRN